MAVRSSAPPPASGRLRRVAAPVLWAGLAALACSAGAAAAVGAQTPTEAYAEACEDGDLLACTLLGLRYERGEGVEADPDRAVALHRRACDGGSGAGCYHLGLLLRGDRGVPADADRARELLVRACRLGEPAACDPGAAAGGDPAAGVPARHVQTGRIGDGSTGFPLAGAVVEVPELGVRVRSDSAGRFGFDALPPGPHPLRVERLGYRTLETTIDVPGDPLLLLLDRADFVPADTVGRIVGTVSGTVEATLRDVAVSVPDRPGLWTLTDDRGRFVLGDLGPGPIRLRFERLGYAPRETELLVRPGRTTDVQVTLDTRPFELDPIRVSVRNATLERAGFYERARSGRGAQLDRESIDELDPMLTSDLLRRVPFVRARFVQGRTVATSTRRLGRGACVLSMVVDGVPMPEADLDWLPPDRVEAVEVYTGMHMPIQYTSRFGACGVVMIWTRR